VPTLADRGYHGAEIGTNTPVKHPAAGRRLSLGSLHHVVAVVLFDADRVQFLAARHRARTVQLRERCLQVERDGTP
jgi:hypothetical protein